MEDISRPVRERSLGIGVHGHHQTQRQLASPQPPDQLSQRNKHPLVCVTNKLLQLVNDHHQTAMTRLFRKCRCLFKETEEVDSDVLEIEVAALYLVPNGRKRLVKGDIELLLITLSQSFGRADEESLIRG